MLATNTAIKARPAAVSNIVKFTAPMRRDPKVSPLMLADRLLTLAQDAERAGLPRHAAKMLKLAMEVWSVKPLN